MFPPLGFYPRCDEEVSQAPLPVGGADRLRAGGTVAVVGRGRRPALHAVSQDILVLFLVI